MKNELGGEYWLERNWGGKGHAWAIKHSSGMTVAGRSTKDEAETLVKELNAR